MIQMTKCERCDVGPELCCQVAWETRREVKPSPFYDHPDINIFGASVTRDAAYKTHKRWLCQACLKDMSGKKEQAEVTP